MVAGLGAGEGGTGTGAGTAAGAVGGISLEAGGSEMDEGVSVEDTLFLVAVYDVVLFSVVGFSVVGLVVAATFAHDLVAAGAGACFFSATLEVLVWVGVSAVAEAETGVVAAGGTVLVAGAEEGGPWAEPLPPFPPFSPLVFSRSFGAECLAADGLTSDFACTARSWRGELEDSFRLLSFGVPFFSTSEWAPSAGGALCLVCAIFSNMSCFQDRLSMGFFLSSDLDGLREERAI